VERNIAGVIFALCFIAFLIILFARSPSPTTQVIIAQSLGSALWKFRSLDVFLQLLILLSGTFGILTLVKERIR